MQNAFGSLGFRYPSVIEMIAPSHIGKTTWIFDLLGRAIIEGCYGVYIECESKQMRPEHVERILHPDKTMANLMLNSILFTSARQLVECDNTLRRSVKLMRAKCDASPLTKGKPIIAVIDPWSTLQSSAEAKGRSDWGVSATAKKEQEQDALTGTNQGHARHAQVMKRWLPEFTEQYNCVVIFVNQQNVKFSMKKGVPAYMAPPETQNDTRIGGEALRQLSSYRFTLIGKDKIKQKTGNKTAYGLNVRMTMIKNSYGPKDRFCDFSVFYDKYADTADTYGRPLSYALGTASWMVRDGIMGTTVNDNRYTCDSLGCVAVSAEELYTALKSNPVVLEQMGSSLNIEGYSSDLDMNMAPTEETEESIAEEDAALMAFDEECAKAEEPTPPPVS